MVSREPLYCGACPVWIELGHGRAATSTNSKDRQRDIASLPERERIACAGSPILRLDGRDLERYERPTVPSCCRCESNAAKGWSSQVVIEWQLRVASRKDGKAFA